MQGGALVVRKKGFEERKKRYGCRKSQGGEGEKRGRSQGSFTKAMRSGERERPARELQQSTIFPGRAHWFC